MFNTLSYKILKKHLLEGELTPGNVVKIRVDQVLLQDPSGIGAWLEFESLGLPKVAPKTVVTYIDHNVIQTGPKNADDHTYLQSISQRFGTFFSKPGNGICHQVHLEQFSKPGEVMLGTDSHTPTCGSMGMLAFGVGGLDAAQAMARGFYNLKVPEIVNIRLEGALKSFVSSKDIILYLLKQFDVAAGKGKIFEYSGTGVQNLSLTQRATVTNMGTELGLKTSIFPSDTRSKEYLRLQGREDVYVPLEPDSEAEFYEEYTVNLSELEPLVACPHSPGNVISVQELNSLEIDQVCIGSCTNSSYEDIMTVSKILEGKKVSKDIEVVLNPGSRRVLELLDSQGALSSLIQSGVRVIEPVCGPCIGVGWAPRTGGKSLRTYNRNYKGRCGTVDSEVYLCSPEVAAVSALTGKVTDPRDLLSSPISIDGVTSFEFTDSLLVSPGESASDLIRKAESIKEIPLGRPIENTFSAEVVLNLGDNITTDDIIPATPEILALRSNIDEISKYLFNTLYPDLYDYLSKKDRSYVIVAGENYGQGSAREHAAIIPMYLGVKVVIAKSFSATHRSNLINFGILPLTFVNPKDKESVDVGTALKFKDVREFLEGDGENIQVSVGDISLALQGNLSKYERNLLLKGGLLTFLKEMDNL